MARDLSSEVDNLATSLAEIRRTLAGLPDQLEGIASVGRRRLGRATDDVTERAKDGVDALEGEIGAHPLVAVGLAFLVGMAFDRFLLR